MAKAKKSSSSKTKFWTKERLDRAIHLYNSGKDWQEVADKMGTTREAVARAVRAYKATKRKAAHPHAEFTREGLGTILKENSHVKGMFLVTAALPTDPTDGKLTQKWYVGSNLHTKGLDTMLSFCKLNKAELIIHPLPAQVSALKDQPYHYDPALKPYMRNFATEYVFNQYLRSLDIGINPQQVNPITGLGRMRGDGDRKTSLIVAHTKQNMELYPTGNNTLPRMIHTTGCITYPAYRNNRVGRIADEDHVIGGLVVIIKDSKFFVHQIQIKSEDGSFNYMGTRYYPDGRAEEERAEALVLGDIHFGHHCSDAIAATYDMFDELAPKEVFLHDVFDGASINPHTWADLFERGTPPPHFSSLSNEIAMCRDNMLALYNELPDDCGMNIVASNHHDFNNRWLRKGQYMNDSVNYAIGHRMIVDKLDGKDPLQIRLDPDGLYNWLGTEDDVVIEGITTSSHGHLGPNGAKGQPHGLERSYDSAVFGHTHTPRIVHRCVWAGHLSKARHGYNSAASSWMQANVAIYKNGERSLLFIMDGVWR
jgi:hypothetical protein